MSDPPFSLSVCGIVVMYFKKSTISCPIYHSIYYIILIKHFYSSKNLLKKPPCASYMDSSWKWASGQLRVKGREGGAESETVRSLVQAFCHWIRNEALHSSHPSHTGVSTENRWKEIECVTYCTPSKKQNLVSEKGSLLLFCSSVKLLWFMMGRKE